MLGIMSPAKTFLPPLTVPCCPRMMMQTETVFKVAFGVWAVLLLISALGMVRAPIEEKQLIERLGEEYRQYMRRTGCFFPRLGRGGDP